MMRRVITIVVLLALGCEDEIVQGTRDEPIIAPTNSAGTTNTTGNTANTPAPNGSAAEEPEADSSVLSYTDADFVELDVQNRDPFRRFLTPVIAAVAPVQRQVVMPDTPIDEMRLIAVVNAGRRRAMLQDRTQVGFIVTEGEYLGREEILQTGGLETVPITLNWRVARIRTSNMRLGTNAEVVLTRTDPTNPDQAPMTRTIPLYDAEDPSQQNLMTQ